MVWSPPIEMSFLSVADQRECLLLDFADCPGDVVGGAGDVAGVDNLDFVDRLDVELGVVAGAQEPRGFADCGRTEAGAGPEGGSAVERYTDNRNVVVRNAVDLGKPGEGAEACVAGDFGCVDGADGLVRCHAGILRCVGSERRAGSVSVLGGGCSPLSGNVRSMHSNS